MNNEEIWKPVVGYEDFYEVSSLGEVRSKDRVVNKGNGPFIKKGIRMKKSPTTTGYYKIRLTDKEGKGKEYKIHRLVAFAFIPNPENKPNINHIDGNPINNHVSNLEWCTQSENVYHAYENGLRKCGLHKYKEEIIKDYVNLDISIKKLSEKYMCSQISISKMLKRKGIKIKPQSHFCNKYKIDRKELVSDFEKGLTNKQIANKHKTNTTLIATYKYKFKKGELII